MFSNYLKHRLNVLENNSIKKFMLKIWTYVEDLKKKKLMLKMLDQIESVEGK